MKKNILVNQGGEWVSTYVELTAEEVEALQNEEQPQEEATAQDMLEAQVIYTALMTDTLIMGDYSNV